MFMASPVAAAAAYALNAAEDKAMPDPWRVSIGSG
jgi:hypothetical protein